MNRRGTRTRIVLGCAMMLGLVAVTSAPTSAADHFSSCRNRRYNLERKLDRDIYHHGYRSREAERDRWYLRSLNRDCGGYWR